MVSLYPIPVSYLFDLNEKERRERYGGCEGMREGVMKKRRELVKIIEKVRK